MNSLFQTIALILALTTGSIGAAQPQDTDTEPTAPDTVVDRLETMLIENMKAGDAMSFDERYASLRPLVEEIMAVERMGRYIFGRDWASFDESKRERFKQAFLDLSAATYAGQFREFGGERFDPVEVREQGEDRVVVKRRLTTGSGTKIAFDYLMLKSDAGWQIVTIITDGVSDLAVKRTQYRRVLDERGLDPVIAHIRESVESQRND